MEIIKNLIIRFWPTGALFLGGFFLIIYIALGSLYLQQASQQRGLEKQIVKLGAVVAKQLPSEEKLRAEYEEANSALAPMTDRAAIAILVGIAEKSGIDIEEDSGKFRISSATFSQAEVGGGTYQLLSFKNIYVQGDYDNVIAFISDLGSGKTLKTMVLTRVDTRDIEIKFGDEEGDRRAEFRDVVSAVIDMMSDNDLSEIPKPMMSFTGGLATNLMGDDPDTEGTVEGFPDITTTSADKGYAGTGSPRNGYVLHMHDKISTDDTTQFETVSYITILTTKYYYTCEADGTVRQWDGPDLATATEYLSSEEARIETAATVNVDIYTKPEE